MNYYLNNRFNNFANSDHLYEGLQRAVDEDYTDVHINVSTVMRSWEYQAGFPLITVTRNETHVTMSQERFLYGSDVSSNLWNVPINYYTKGNSDSSATVASLWLSTASATIPQGSLVKSWSFNDWVIFNTKQVNFQLKIVITATHRKMMVYS